MSLPAGGYGLGPGTRPGSAAPSTDRAEMGTDSYKPDSVPALRRATTIPLSDRNPELTLPWQGRCGPHRCSLFGLAPEGVCTAPSISLGAVGSYPTFSPLPGARFRALRPATRSGRFVFCGAVLPTASGPWYPAFQRDFLPCGVRTFLPPRRSRGEGGGRPLSVTRPKIPREAGFATAGRGASRAVPFSRPKGTESLSPGHRPGRDGAQGVRPEGSRYP